MQIIDFKCTYQNFAGVNEDITKNLTIKFPDAYLYSDEMIILGKAIRDYEKTKFIELPFCHTIEADAFGAKINYGDAQFGPRTKEYILTELNQFLDLPNIDYSNGRIKELLKAIEKLVKDNEDVVTMISGPFTILNSLLDTTLLFKSFRKDKELVKRVFEKIKFNLINFSLEIEKAGCRFISYADSAGAVNIIGPNIAKTVVYDFTYDFIKELSIELNKNTMLLLCPKTSLALISMGLAKFNDVSITSPINYFDALKSKLGELKITGQMCIKNKNYVLKHNVLKEILLEDKQYDR